MTTNEQVPTTPTMTAADWGREAAKAAAHQTAAAARSAHPAHCFCDTCSEARNAARNAR